jgi:CRISPR-associated protein Cas2
MAHFLICYDIANPKRLGRVHRRAVKHAAFVQYSVYYLIGAKSDLDAMLGDIQDVIDDDQDDVRAYTVEPLSDAIRVGACWLPEDIFLK